MQSAVSRLRIVHNSATCSRSVLCHVSVSRAHARSGLTLLAELVALNAATTAIAMILLAITTLATQAPSRIDPLKALRDE